MQIVGSDNHYSYQRQYQQYNRQGSTTLAPRYRQNNKHIDERVDISYPVKTVQRYTDSDGNVKVVTSYSNSGEASLPIYKDDSLRVLTPPKRKLGYRGHYHVTPLPTIPPSSYIKPVIIPQPRSLPIKEEYTRTKTIRFPGSDGELNTNEYEAKTKDANSSAYNQQTSYNRSYKKPELRISNGHSRGKDVAQPLQSASSSYITENIDDGIADDIGGDYIGGSVGHYHSAPGYSHHGYGSPHISVPHVPIITHGPIIPHAPILTHGHIGSHGPIAPIGPHEEKGDSGDKGHKSHEVYSKGHSEKHGHEENKGGHVEESGEKTGHHDEENHYSKGHSASSGHKGTEKEHVKGHKKGHKTKGFRTVHHKDEYKKDEVFYDEEHDAGSQKNHGHDQSEHKHAEGGKSKKGHLNSGYKDAQKGYHGDKEEGHSYESSKGHTGHEGHNSHHAHHQHYNKGEGHTEGEVHGHGGKGYFR
ncbi:hypothetical protein O3M35_011043 [Rhynocoris fuscipes]|uniref:Uncharacterized protein n=1 Tax=Rhynocoris fuscipes TaxID=488301 RepID=A0AAW1CW58_9HEMI